MINKTLMKSGNNDWRTPDHVYKELDKEFSFDFDPCPNNPDFDGLNVDWGKCSFVNPPYKTKIQDAFVKKAVDEWKKGKTVVLLLPVRTSSRRWQNLILPNAKEIRFLKRLIFDGANDFAPFDSAIIILK